LIRLVAQSLKTFLRKLPPNEVQGKEATSMGMSERQRKVNIAENA
jgi:hypothetical protein